MDLATLGGALRRDDAARALDAKGCTADRARGGEHWIGKLAGRRVHGAQLARFVDKIRRAC